MDKDVISKAIDFAPIGGMTLRDVERMDYTIRQSGGVERSGYTKEEGVAALLLWRTVRGLKFTEKGTQMTVDEFLDLSQRVRATFIQQHMANHTANYYLYDMYDWLVKKRMMNRNADRYWRKVKKCFDDYKSVHKQALDGGSWVLFLDHMSLVYDATEEKRESLENAVRDYLIQHRSDITDAGQKDDIALLQRVAVCFMFLTTMQTHYVDFFVHIVKEYGVDFSSEFKYADLPQMMYNVMWMFEQVGVRFAKDDDGDTVLLGVNVNKSARITGAWKAIEDFMFGNEILDATALEAINLNPEMKRDYEERMAKKEEAAFEESLDRLNEKYFVKHEGK